MLSLKEKWEDLDRRPIPASTAFNVGDALEYNGSGSVIPATPGLPIAGIGLVNVASGDPDYSSSAKQIPFQRPGSINQYHFSIPVHGTATSAMVGLKFNLYTDAGTLDVSAYSTLTYNTLAISTFAAGHIITGGTSGATGVITYVNTLPNGSQQLVFTVTSGTFVSGETITDGTSSATAKILTVFTGGTQFEVTEFISSSLVEVTVALPA